jgi:ubiquinone/menaquinone biosynthesis C-methylase UbiE
MYVRATAEWRTIVMAEADNVFAGSIPKLYDDYMVPLIFQAFAEDLARRVAAFSPSTVLETAAGTGVVTRALAARLAATARYVATDLNRAMLDLASQRQGVDARITWQVADALALPFEIGAFDVVCCQFGVMFFPDRVQGFREAKRVLKPSGHFVFNAWDRIEANAFPFAVSNALAEVFPADPPRFMARVPHGYHDVTLIRDELAKAGFANVTIETRTEIARATSPRHVAVAFCQGTPLRAELEARGAGQLQVATDNVEAAITREYGTGEVAANIQAHVIVAS